MKINEWGHVCILLYLRVVKTHKLVLRLVLMDGAFKHSISSGSRALSRSDVVTLSRPNWNTGHILYKSRT